MCACVIKREKWRETEWISVCGLCGLGVCVCVWDVNRGEVHWASELVQSGFWHARAVHTNFIGSRWHDSPYGLAATACSLWTYPQILLSVCPVMLHALTRINSAVWFPSNPGRRATSGLFAPLSLFSSPHPACFAWQGLCCVVGCVTFRRVDFCSVWSICLYSHQSGRVWITAGNTKDLILPDLSAQIYARRLSAKKTFHLCQARHFTVPEALTLFADISTVLCRCIMRVYSFF